MAVVDAAADRVTLNDFDTHDDGNMGFLEEALSRR